MSAPALGACAITAVFLVITYVWLGADDRVPHYDPARHLLIAFGYLDALRGGDLLAPITQWHTYPPGTHMVAALGMAVGGEGMSQAVMALNLVFVPLLVLGCYHSGRLVFEDRRAGLLAVAFALGTPLLVAQFHVMMLDASEAAMVACSVWLLLASRNFEDVRYAALAGFAVGFGMLTKQTFAWFVLGVLLVMLLRGGWRQWRGLLVFALVAAVICGPWFIAQADEVLSQASAVSRDSVFTTSGTPSPKRYSLENAQWYFWSGLNFQVRLPLLLFAVIGTVVAVVRLVRDRTRLPLQLEMLVGGLVGWAGITWTLSHEPRYSIPVLIYMAVLGTGWMLLLRRIPRTIAFVAFGCLVAINAFGASFGWGPATIRFNIPGGPDPAKSYVQAGRVTLYSNDGFVFGAPKRGGDLLPVLQQLKAEGVRRIFWNNGDPLTASFNDTGLTVFARIAGLKGSTYDSVRGSRGRDEATLLAQPVKAGDRPCVNLEDGTGVWIYRGDPSVSNRANGCPTGQS